MWKSQTPLINKEEKILLECKMTRDNIKSYIKRLERNANLKKRKNKIRIKIKKRKTEENLFYHYQKLSTNNIRRINK